MKYTFQSYGGSGKIGNMVAYRILGRNVLREWRPTISNPNTSAQQLQRAKFKKIMQLCARCKAGVNIGMVPAAKIAKLFPYNIFLQENLQALTGSTPSNLSLTLNKLKFSKGGMIGVGFSNSVTYNSGQATVVIDENNLDIEGVSTSDKIYLLAYCADLNMFNISQAITRSQDRVSVRIPSLWDGNQVSFYGIVVSADGKDAAETVFIRTMEIGD